jgi:hypothetical protein
MAQYPYQVMLERKDALERLDLVIRWGRYEIKVLRFHYTSFESGKVINFHKHGSHHRIDDQRHKKGCRQDNDQGDG